MPTIADRPPPGNPPSKNPRRAKPNLDSILDKLLTETGIDPRLTPDTYKNIAGCGLQVRNLPLAFVATSILIAEKPITLRGLFYRVVSAGLLPSTDKEHYQRLGRILTTLRESGIVPFDWLVDNVRSTLKPSSWSGIADFADTVRDAYRKNLWASLPNYVHIIAEKDAIAGVLSPVCHEFDVRLSPIRGYVSLSFAHEIASTWSQIEKPITCYYLGDYDPSGFDLERDVLEKLKRYCGREFSWERLGVNEPDFDDFNLIELATKTTDRRAAGFIREHGDRCAELDALPATELRRRVREAIESQIPPGEWERLKEVEAVEKSSWESFMSTLAGGEQ